MCRVPYIMNTFAGYARRPHAPPRAACVRAYEL